MLLLYPSSLLEKLCLEKEHEKISRTSVLSVPSVANLFAKSRRILIAM
jgi:hypothetical protein